MGDALGAFFGRDFFLAEMQPLIDGIEGATRDAPLAEGEIRRAAGTIGGEFGD